MTETQTHI